MPEIPNMPENLDADVNYYENASTSNPAEAQPKEKDGWSLDDVDWKAAAEAAEAITGLFSKKKGSPDSDPEPIGDGLGLWAWIGIGTGVLLFILLIVWLAKKK